MEDGCYSGGEAAGHGNHLIASFDLPVAKFRRCQGHKGQEVSGGAAVDQADKFNADPVGKITLKSIGESSCGEPKIQCGIHQAAHFFFVIDPGGIGQSVSWGERLILPGFFEHGIVISHQCFNLLSCLCFVIPVGHNRPPINVSVCGKVFWFLYFNSNVLCFSFGNQLISMPEKNSLICLSIRAAVSLPAA